MTERERRFLAAQMAMIFRPELAEQLDKVARMSPVRRWIWRHLGR